MALSANYSDASSSGVSNSGNNAVITHGRNGANLPAFPFAGDAQGGAFQLTPTTVALGLAGVLVVLLVVRGAR